MMRGKERNRTNLASSSKRSAAVQERFRELPLLACLLSPPHHPHSHTSSTTSPAPLLHLRLVVQLQLQAAAGQRMPQRQGHQAQHLGPHRLVLQRLQAGWSRVWEGEGGSSMVMAAVHKEYELSGAAGIAAAGAHLHLQQHVTTLPAPGRR